MRRSTLGWGLGALLCATVLATGFCGEPPRSVAMERGRLVGIWRADVGMLVAERYPDASPTELAEVRSRALWQWDFRRDGSLNVDMRIPPETELFGQGSWEILSRSPDDVEYVVRMQLRSGTSAFEDTELLFEDDDTFTIPSASLTFHRHEPDDENRRRAQ